MWKAVEEQPKEIGNLAAPEGTVWVCGACGKTSTTKYGFDGTADRGWDVSCMMNAVLCHAKGDADDDTTTD